MRRQSPLPRGRRTPAESFLELVCAGAGGAWDCGPREERPAVRLGVWLAGPAPWEVSKDWGRGHLQGASV